MLAAVSHVSRHLIATLHSECMSVIKAISCATAIKTPVRLSQALVCDCSQSSVQQSASMLRAKRVHAQTSFSTCNNCTQSAKLQVSVFTMVAILNSDHG